MSIEFSKQALDVMDQCGEVVNMIGRLKSPAQGLTSLEAKTDRDAFDTVVDSVLDEIVSLGYTADVWRTHLDRRQRAKIGTPAYRLSDQEFIDLAKKKYESEGDLEFDESSQVYRNEEGTGAYVQAWKWVDAPEPPDSVDNEA